MVIDNITYTSSIVCMQRKKGQGRENALQYVKLGLRIKMKFLALSLESTLLVCTYNINYCSNVPEVSPSG